MDHSRAPILDALTDFRRRGDVVFGPPGHKQGRGVDRRVLDILGEGMFRSDVLTLNGLDDRRQSAGLIEDAQELMADAVRADRAFFSTCGSSLSVKAAMISVAGPGEKLLVSRNAHKSVLAALIVGGIHPVPVAPRYDTALHLAHPPGPAEYRQALREHPDAKGALVITPTDWGSCADLAGIAQVCHAHDVPLIVDEAWGAHLPFHPDLPPWGIDAGADLVVTSVHKMGAAIEQSSVFHLQGDRVDPQVLKAREDLLGTTSASTLVYAALDGWRRQMVEQGRQLLTGALDRVKAVRRDIARIDGLAVMGADAVGPAAAADLDILRVTVDVRGLGVTGFTAAEWLREHHHVDVGASDTCRLVAQFTHADDDTTAGRLLVALHGLADADGLPPAPPVEFPGPAAFTPEVAMLPRTAFFGPTEQIPVGRAVGRVCAELVTPYPPGVPMLAPGERIGAEAVRYLISGVEAGMLIPDAADPTCRTLRVTRPR